MVRWQSYETVTILQDSFDIDLTSNGTVSQAWQDYAHDIALYIISTVYHGSTESNVVFIGADYDFESTAVNNIKMKFILGYDAATNPCANIYNGINAPFKTVDKGNLDPQDYGVNECPGFEWPQSQVAKAVSCYYGNELPAPDHKNDRYVGDIIIKEINPLFSEENVVLNVNSDDATPSDGIKDYLEMYLKYYYTNGILNGLNPGYYLRGTTTEVLEEAACYSQESLNYYYDTHVDFIETLRPVPNSSHPASTITVLFLRANGYNSSVAPYYIPSTLDRYHEASELTEYYFVHLFSMIVPHTPIPVIPFPPVVPS